MLATHTLPLPTVPFTTLALLNRRHLDAATRRTVEQELRLRRHRLKCRIGRERPGPEPRRRDWSEEDETR
jgi:hypothetical protein